MNEKHQFSSYKIWNLALLATTKLAVIHDFKLTDPLSLTVTWCDLSVANVWMKGSKFA